MREIVTHLFYKPLGSSFFEMAKRPAEQRGGSVDSGQELLIDESSSDTLVIPRALIRRVSGTGSQASDAGSKIPGYYSKNGYLKTMSRQERRRIQQEIQRGYKPGKAMNV